ncbi:MAG: DUF308 domain-containing protein [Lachnospiraceae bacterium]|nr:DUF308 domain-containing protein [Lachnospiraceae bacterium]
MTKLQRVKSLAAGLIMVLTAVVMFKFPDDSYVFILTFLGVGFFVTGIGTLSYYFNMARFMVGGKMILYKGVILVDFAVLTCSLTDVPRIYILIYLAALHGFSGMIELLRAGETRRSGSTHYKLKLFHGILNIVMALSCVVFVGKPNTAVFIYSLGLVYSGIIRMVTAFRRTAFVYIR